MVLKKPNPPTLFLSTPSARRATRPQRSPTTRRAISIHALREEGDRLRERPAGAPQAISIHALREEGDLWDALRDAARDDFYPRPPRGGRRPRSRPRCLPPNFYPRPPRGGRLFGVLSPALSRNFYPRPPRGGRPVFLRLSTEMIEFLSTPSARRATAKTETKSLFSNKLYNILHEFRRALIYNGSKSYPNHAK